MTRRQIFSACVSTGNVLLIALLLLTILGSYLPAQAQANLLTNPDFEQAFGDGVTLAAPPGWGVRGSEFDRTGGALPPARDGSGRQCRDLFG